MHIAICDYNVADRKQTERLMGREADKWISKGDPLYVYSFGSVESLMANSMHYDAIIIDVTNVDSWDTKTVMGSLKSHGVDGAIIMCSEKQDLSVELSDMVMYLPKPISANLLHELIEKVSKLDTTNMSLIELRCITETHYIREEELMYATGDGEYTDVHLTDGRILRTQGRVESLFENASSKNKHLVMSDYVTILNTDYIDKYRLNKATMTDGRIFKVMRFSRDYIKMMLAQRENNQTM